MKRAAFSLAVFALIMLWAQSFRQTEAALAELPSVVYLGEGAGQYSVNPGGDFIVKRLYPFRFDFEPGVSYTAVAGERVWGMYGSTEAPPAVYDAWNEFGEVQAGCLIDYIGIDDDLDGRLNRFYLNGAVIHTIAEGMVFSGEFIVPEDGQLRMFAEDSVGGWVTVCEEVLTPTPDPSDTPTNTPPPTETATNTPTPTIDPSVTPSVTPTDEPGSTVTSTAEPTETESPPDITATPTTTPTPGFEEPPPLPTPTKEPRENACLRINFEISGDEALRGLFVVQEVGGRVLASWYAEEGWQDSGWIKDIDITFPSVYVQVLYYSGPGADPIVMRILNPAPDSEYGWLGRGMCHALEVGWP